MGRRLAAAGKDDCFFCGNLTIVEPHVGTVDSAADVAGVVAAMRTVAQGIIPSRASTYRSQVYSYLRNNGGAFWSSSTSSYHIRDIEDSTANASPARLCQTAAVAAPCARMRCDMRHNALAPTDREAPLVARR